jgi:hypothetical protein
LQIRVTWPDGHVSSFSEGWLKDRIFQSQVPDTCCQIYELKYLGNFGRKLRL